MQLLEPRRRLDGRGLRVAARILVGWTVTVLCFLVAFRETPLEELARILAGANLSWVVIAGAAQIIWMFVRAERWRLLLAGCASFPQVFWAQAIGFLATNVLPIRAGEAARVLVVSQQSGTEPGRVGASIVLERMLDIMAVLVLLACLLQFIEVPVVVRGGGLILGGAFAAGALCVLGLTFLGEPATRAVARCTRPLPARVREVVNAQWVEFVAGLRSFRGLGAMTSAAAWSVFAWVVGILSTWAVLEAVVPASSAIEASFFVAAVALGIAVPSSPGFFGVFQLVGQQALVLAFPERYTPSTALAAAVLAHALYYCITTAVGTIGLIRWGFSLPSLRRRSTPVQP